MFESISLSVEQKIGNGNPPIFFWINLFLLREEKYNIRIHCWNKKKINKKKEKSFSLPYFGRLEEYSLIKLTKQALNDEANKTIDEAVKWTQSAADRNVIYLRQLGCLKR